MNKAVKKASPKHPYVFKIIIYLLPLVIVLFIEGILNIANYGENLDLFIENETEGYENFMMVNPNVGKKYFQKFEYTSPPNDIFYAKKPANTFRIFVMGSSTVYGFPYDRNLMFSRILNKQLEDYFPDKKIEVINTAITAINSFTLLDFAGQILKYEPDAILIYAGHNEFYGAFGIGSNETMGRNRALTRLHVNLMSMRIYQLLRNAISGLVKNYPETSARTNGTLMKRIVNDAEIEFDSEVYQLGMANYQKNMNAIIAKFQKRNIPVFLSDLVSNVKDLKPFNSLENSSSPSAIEVYNTALAENENGNFEEAKSLFYKAKDLDCIRFRASEDANEIIHKLAEKNNNVFKVSVLDRFKENSENDLIGDNLMTEHVHPNIDGIFLISQAFLDKIIESGAIGEPNKSINYSNRYYKTNWGYSALDSLIGMHRANFLKGFWPFVKNPQEERNYFQSYQPKNYLDLIVISGLRSSGESLGVTRLNVARNYEKEGRFDLAYREYEAILRENPYVAIHYRDAAKALLKLDDLPLALKYYSKSLEFEKSFEALFSMGNIYMKKGDFDNAIETLKQAIHIAPEEKKANVSDRLHAAYVYNRMPQKADSVAEIMNLDDAFLEVEERSYIYDTIVPFQTKHQIDKAEQYVSEENYEDALRVLKSSLEIYDSHIANRKIAELLVKLNCFDEAQKYFLKVYPEFKYDSTFLHQLVLLCQKMGEKDRAKVYLEEIENVDPFYKGINNLHEVIM